MDTPAASPAAPSVERLPADPRFRRQAAILLAVLVVLGAVIVVLFDRWVMDVRQMPPRQAAGRLLAGYLAWTVACSAALLVLAAVLWRTGVQAITTARFPIAGTRVLRDTPVLVGDEAVRRGRALKVLAGVLCGCVVAVAVMAWLLTRRLAT